MHAACQNYQLCQRIQGAALIKVIISVEKFEMGN
jgi:hypothetical protein